MMLRLMVKTIEKVNITIINYTANVWYKFDIGSIVV